MGRARSLARASGELPSRSGRSRCSVGALSRATRHVAAALRAIHDEQVLMWDLLWQASGISANEPPDLGALRVLAEIAEAVARLPGARRSWS